MPAVLPLLSTHPCIRKRPEPIMVPADLPYACSLVFNAGVIKHRGEYIMVFRNDYGYISGTRFTGTLPAAKTESTAGPLIQSRCLTVLTRRSIRS